MKRVVSFLLGYVKAHTMSYSDWMPLRRVLCTLLLCIAALWAMPRNAHAQLYVSQYVGASSGSVGEYNASTGAAINANLITGLNTPTGLVVAGNILFVANIGPSVPGAVGEYNASTGAAINASFITGLSQPIGLAVSGNNLFVANYGGTTVGEYNATTGAVINASFITGLIQPSGAALSGNSLFVFNGNNDTVGEYNATTGAAINASLITVSAFSYGLAVAGPPLPCTLDDTATYDATSGTLTMNFTIGNSIYSAATWNAWLTYQASIKSLFSVPQPITNPPQAITETRTGLPKAARVGVIGVLSTLTTPTQGIVCSSWVQTNTGTP